MTVPVLIDGRVIYVSVPRRRILQGIGVGLGALTLGSSSPPRLSATNASATPIEHLRLMRIALAEADNIVGPEGVMDAVRGQLAVIDTLRPTRRGQDLADLFALQVEYADLLAWLHQDLGQHQASQWWLDRALEASYTAGDPRATAFMLARKAQLAGDMLDGATASAIGAAAVAMAPSRSRIQGIAAVHTAHGHALQGDQRACLDALDVARTAAVDLREDASPYGMALSTSYVDVHHARAIDVLGDHQSAVDGYGRAIASMPPSWRRDAAVYTAWQALAHAHAGEPDQAAHVALQALDVGRQTRSTRTLTHLTLADQALARWSTPTVATFHAALTGDATRAPR